MADGNMQNMDLGAMLEGAMNDPRFGEILSTLQEKTASGELDPGKLMESFFGGAVSASESAPKEENAQNIQNIQNIQNGNFLSHIDDHKRLLFALKPYLSDGKRDAVEGLLKVGAIGEIAKKLGDSGLIK